MTDVGHAFSISTFRGYGTKWLHLRNEGTLVASLHEFDKNSITKVAVSGSPGEVVSRRRPWTRRGVAWRLVSVTAARHAGIYLPLTRGVAGRAGGTNGRGRPCGRDFPSVCRTVCRFIACRSGPQVSLRPGDSAGLLRTPGRSVDSGTLGRRWALLKSLRFDSFVSWFVVCRTRHRYWPVRP